MYEFDVAHFPFNVAQLAFHNAHFV